MKRSNLKKNEGRGNAFDRLMQPRPRKSRFVECPAGCGSHVLEQNLNEHLDKCLAGSTIKAVGETKADVAMPSERLNDATTGSYKDGDSNGIQESSRCESVAVSQSPQPSPQTMNAFSFMMEQSQKVFSHQERQRFHLDANGKLTWTNVSDAISHDIAWSSTVVLRASRMMAASSGEKHGPDSTIQPRDVELTISSSIPPSPTPLERLVSRHSRLSVPVIKSMLQKSIRRRRPLPAVRLAMEFADKAMGELLRRLPIIILEDSTLHPQLDLLVWLIVAESKDFVIPTVLFVKVLQTVYEMASCPWTDYLPVHREGGDSILLSSSIPTANDGDDLCQVMVRSILLRAQYGGMAGDIKMLHDYARLWFTRFQDGVVPSPVVERLSPKHVLSSSEQAPLNTNLQWKDVPAIVHSRARDQSRLHVEPLVQRGLDKLSLRDACLEGVDFHCSPILDHVLNNDAMIDECCERLSSIVSAEEVTPKSKHERRSHLFQVLRTCMWKFSAGVNHRRPLLVSSSEQSDEKHSVALKKFWDDTMASGVERYQKQYVQNRLAG